MSQPQYAIMRFAKYKGPEITNIEAHNERRKEKYASNPDIDLSRSKHNFHLIEPPQRYRAEAEQQISAAGCRTRKDSVRLVEVLFTATPEFFQGKKPPEIRQYFEEESGSTLKKHSTSWSSIKPKKQSSLPWCIWTRRRPICTFPLSP